jgi:hypothetical protein
VAESHEGAGLAALQRHHDLAFGCEAAHAGPVIGARGSIVMKGCMPAPMSRRSLQDPVRHLRQRRGASAGRGPSSAVHLAFIRTGTQVRARGEPVDLQFARPPA